MRAAASVAVTLVIGLSGCGSGDDASMRQEPVPPGSLKSF